MKPDGVSVLLFHRADAWGRTTLFLAAFLVLPLRGALFALAVPETRPTAAVVSP